MTGFFISVDHGIGLNWHMERRPDGTLVIVDGQRPVKLPAEVNMPLFLKAKPEECMDAVRAMCSDHKRGEKG